MLNGRMIRSLIFCGLTLASAVLLSATFAGAQEDAPAAEKPAEQAVQAPAENAAPAPAEKQAENAPEATEMTLPAETAPAETAPADNNAPAENAPAADAQTEELPDAAENPIIEAAPAAPVEKKDHKGSIMIFGAVFLIIVAAYLFSVFFAKVWRMPDYQAKYFIVLFCFLAALCSTIFGLVGHRMNLGIDLRGGSILVYGVSPTVSDTASEAEIKENEGKTITAQEMSELKAALTRRINPAGVKEIAIQELGNNAEIKITIPEADEAEVARIERRINSAGQLKFRILVSTDSPEEKELIDLARSPENANAYEIRLPEPIGKDRIILGGTWTPIDPTQVQEFLSRRDAVIREAPQLSQSAKDEGVTKGYEALVLDLTDLYNVYGKHMARVQEGVGDRGQPIVRFEMNTEGAERMKHLTDRYRAGADRARGRGLGIVMNDSLYSAPEIRAKIERNGEITMGGDDMSAESRERIQKDVRDLILVMNAGVLPAKLTDRPVTKMLTGPTLGEDTIQKGKNSIMWSGILVLAFMIAYYGFSGLVACFAVLMNLLLIMAVMLSLRAAFTLPGLAGLVLTVGMAVDANVLIFERIKEELNGGATLKMAINNGFQRAFTAIFDSNITTMITAVILYSVGTDQVKGFAVTLFLGVAFSLFTATYVSRIIFETSEKLGLIGKRCVYPILPGLKAFGRTSFDFMSKKSVAISFSAILILIGLAAVFVRGKGIFDIDFVGGVEVQTIFNQPQSIADIRSKLKEFPDLSVSNLSLSKDRAGNDVQENCCFTISTSCPPKEDAEAYRTRVEKELREAFGESLRHGTLAVGASTKGTKNVAGEDIATIITELKVDPPVAQEVMIGYFDDELPAFLKEKGLAELKFEMKNPELNIGTRDNPFADWTVEMETGDETLAKELADRVAHQVSNMATFESSQTIGSSVASYARMQGILAILGSLIFIMLYIWFRFKRAVFGLSAVVALVHDVLITLGMIALSVWLAPMLGFMGVSEFKIGLPTVAAFLTIIGYSLNDTIILFDRIREIRGKNTVIDADIINLAINQTLSRTILTSLTTLFVALVLYFFGGGGIHTFAFAMVVGVITGTFSSIFIAPPVMLWMLRLRDGK